MGGAKSIVPSTVKVAAAGARIDIPLHHVTASYVRSHFDSIEFCVPDGPRPDEIVFIVAASIGGRPHATGRRADGRRHQAGGRPKMSDPSAGGDGGARRLYGRAQSRRRAAVNAACNFPHVRLAGGKVVVWQNHGDYKLDDFVARAGDGWARSQWDERTPIHVGSDKVHLKVKFSRFRADGSLIGRFETIYIVTLQNGHWGIQARSSFAS